MNEDKKVPEAPKVVEAPVIVPDTPPVVTPEAQQVDLFAIFKANDANYKPANWVLTPDEEEEEIVNGRNLVTGMTFRGTVPEFNGLIRSI